MSLFSGMRLVNSDHSGLEGETENPGVGEKLKKNETTASSTPTGIVGGNGHSSPFSFMPGTKDRRSSRDSQATRPFVPDEVNTDISSDGQCSADNTVRDSRKSASLDISLSDDLTYDLDPIKVIVGTPHNSMGHHHPAGLDLLQDLDFSLPVDHQDSSGGLMEEEDDAEQDTQTATSESRFGFIMKGPAPSSDESSALADDCMLQLDTESQQSLEGSKGGPAIKEDSLAREQTTNQGDDAGDNRPSLWETLHIYKQECAMQLHAIRKSSQDIVDQTCQLAKNCVTSGRDLLQKQCRLQYLQEQQQQAVDVEDYEKAEELHLQCCALEDQMSPADAPLPSSHPAFRSSLADLESLCIRETAERQAMAQRYKQLIAEQQQAMEDSRGRCSQLESGHLRTVQEERSKLDRDLGHLHLDKEHLGKREAHLADQIDERTANIRQSRDSLMAERAQIQDEISVLEARLATLRQQEADISQSIVAEDREIEEVSRDFDDERSAVERERGQLEETEAELTKRRERLEEDERRQALKREEIEAATASQSRLLANLEEDLGKEKAAISELNDGHLEILSKLKPEENTTTLSESRECLLKEKTALRQMNAEVQQEASSLLHSQTRVVTLRQKVSDTEGHIAALNESKQLAVSGRNFSEAKRLADEIKRLIMDGQHIQEEMEELIKGNDGKSKTVMALRGDLERLQQDVDDQERQIELATKDRLLEHVNYLRGRPHDHMLGSSTPLFQALHRAELVSACLQIKFLCLKHGLHSPDELEELLVEEEEEAREHLNEVLKDEEDEEEGRLRQDYSRDGEAMDEELKAEVETLEAQLQQAV